MSELNRTHTPPKALTQSIADAFDAVDAAKGQKPEPSAKTYVWDDLAENIDEFAVAKCIVDHFEANPKDLRVDGMQMADMLGLVLRAKVTIKREQIAFALANKAREDAEAAVRKARESSRSVQGLLRSLSGFCCELRPALQANAGAVAIALAVSLVLLYR